MKDVRAGAEAPAAAVVVLLSITTIIMVAAPIYKHNGYG